jgi:hypothetical protein
MPLPDTSAALVHAEHIIDQLRKAGTFNDDLTIVVKNELHETVLNLPFRRLTRKYQMGAWLIPPPAPQAFSLRNRLCRAFLHVTVKSGSPSTQKPSPAPKPVRAAASHQPAAGAPIRSPCRPAPAARAISRSPATWRYLAHLIQPVWNLS